MKILFIGNSFSQDATRYMQAISDGELLVRNLYIGGCSLETHAENIKNNAPTYEYQSNAEMIDMCSIADALKREAWDFVSVQQVSSYSGIPESYEPYISEVMDFVRQLPSAKIVFHKTWAYETGSTHPEFCRYNNDRALMYSKINATADIICKKYKLPVIPSGDVIEQLRALPELCGVGEAKKITRDGFHLSLDYGRYAAGLTAFCFFTEKRAADTSFAPEGTDPVLIKKIRETVDNTL